MNPLATRKIGKLDLSVTALGLGGTSHGNMYKALSEEKALEAIATHNLFNTFSLLKVAC